MLVWPRLGLAHPMGNFSVNHYTRIVTGAERIEIDYIIDMAEIPTFQEMQRTGIVPRVGDVLRTNQRRPILTLVEDTSAGIHDTLIAACDRYRYAFLGVEGPHDNCTDNLHAGLAELGLVSSHVPSPLNLFMNIPWSDDGRLRFAAPPNSLPGSYVVLRIWDDRRLIIPLQYFIEKPFQNWTRSSAQLLGSVFIYVDFAMPIKPLREEVERIVRAAPQWDQRFFNLQVTDVTERTVQLRVLCTAASSSLAFDLRCLVREGLLGFMQREYPQFLPKMRIEGERGPATPPPALK